MILEARAILDTEKIERLTEGVRKVITYEVMHTRSHTQRLREVMPCAASLANHGLLGSVDILVLYGVDLSPVPAQHLASLISCVTKRLRIQNLSGGDLVSVLTSLKCEELHINRQSLGTEETRALVQAMDSGVKKVVLIESERVTLDIDALTKYSGQGVCNRVELYYAQERYNEDLRTWARSRNWNVDMKFSDRFLKWPKYLEIFSPSVANFLKKNVLPVPSYETRSYVVIVWRGSPLLQELETC